MKRRSSSRPARSARPSSQRQRSGPGRRSLGPLLPLALPVLATALTLASLLINVTAVALSAAGLLTPLTGALWHNAGALFVVGNAALLLRDKDIN